MWPMLLDMSKRECKIELRKLELDAYSTVVSTFRAQGNLNPVKIQVLKELETFFKISCDRSKAEMRRACNDEKLFTIAKKLSHGECVTSEWVVHSKRMIPLLPRLQHTKISTAPSYYRILADHILQNSRPMLKLYSQPSETSCENINIKEEQDGVNEQIKPPDFARKINPKLIKKKHKSDETTQEDSRNKSKQKEQLAQTNMLHLANGYAVSSNFVEIKKHDPSEFIREHELRSEDDNTFLKNLIDKYKKQKEEKERLQELFVQSAQKFQKAESTEPKKTLEQNETTKAVKNSRLISQMIETKNSVLPVSKKENEKESNKQESMSFKNSSTTITNTTSVAAPGTPVKISSSAQIIRLDSPIYPQIPTGTTLSLLNSNTSLPASIQMNSSHTIITNNNQNNGSTIVKLNSAQPILNSSNNITQTNSSFGQLLNLNNQNLKHFVLPKMNQKLIILPPNNSINNNNNSNNSNSLNQTTSMKKNYLINSNSSTNNANHSSNSNIRILTQENGEKITNNSQIRIIPSQNGQNPLTQVHGQSSLQKVILSYKSSSNHLTNLIKIPSNRPNESSANLDEKNFKIIQMKTEFDLTLSNSTPNESAQLNNELSSISKEPNSLDEQDNENTNSNSSDKFEKSFKRKILNEESTYLTKQKIIRLETMNNSNNTSESPLSSSSSILSASPAEKNNYECIDDLNSDLKVFKDIIKSESCGLETN